MAQNVQYDPALHNPQGLNPGDPGWDPSKAAFPEGATMGTGTGPQRGETIGQDQATTTSSGGSGPGGIAGTGPSSQSRR